MKKSKKMDKGNTLTVHNMDKNVSDRRKTDTRQYGERVEEIEAITGTYTNNYNICNIDKRIKNYLEQEKKEINNIDEEIERLDWIIENTEDKKEKTTAKNEKMQKIQRKEDIITNKRMNEYISKTKDYIDNYLLVLPPRSESAFFRSLLLFFLSYLLYSLLSNPIFLSLHLYYLFLSSLVLYNFLFFYLYYIYYSYLYMFPLLPLFLLLSPHTV